MIDKRKKAALDQMMRREQKLNDEIGAQRYFMNRQQQQ
nr:hypothetical protein [Vibrio mexicanus]